MGKTFRIARSDEDAPKPFDMEFEQEDGTFATHAFSAVGRIPGAVILDLMASGGLEPTYQAAALRSFFTRALVPDDRKRFSDLIETSVPPIELSQLTEISNWLVEQYNQERPTQSAAQ